MPRIRVSCGFVLLISIVYFFDDNGMLAATLPPVIIHELSHIAAMLFFGARIVELRATLTGVALNYSGYLTNAQKLVTSAAGPVIGLSTSLLFSAIGNRICSDYLLTAAGVGVILNVFNFLPIFPLDGGRILRYSLTAFFGASKANKATSYASAAASSILTVLSLYLIYRFGSITLFIPALWLLIFSIANCCKYRKMGI